MCLNINSKNLVNLRGLVTKMKMAKISACVAGMAMSASISANIGVFATSGKTIEDHTFIEQGGRKAENIKSVLANIKLPAGFKIDLYAIVPDARDMAMAPQGTALFVGTRKDKVWVVSDRDRDGVADEVKDFAPSLSFDVPNGVQFSKDGFLYIAERNHVRMFPAAEFFFEGPDVVAVDIIPKGELIPVEEESYNHTARVIDIGPDNKVYISLGQPFNVAPPEKLDLYNDVGIGGIIRMDRDGSNREVYTYGVRNSVGQDFHPVTGELWWTDNQVDGMGDDIPPGELNRQTEKGQHFGHPWFGGGTVRVSDFGYDKAEVPEGIVHPVVETTAHCADLGMAFYTGNQFPSKYKNGIFVAQHGSWNRTVPCGARVMFASVDDEGNATMEPFAEGWLNENGEYDGRPMSVTQMKDGSILVSDDYAGAIYRISYDAGS